MFHSLSRILSHTRTNKASNKRIGVAACDRSVPSSREDTRVAGRSASEYQQQCRQRSHARSATNLHNSMPLVSHPTSVVEYDLDDKRNQFHESVRLSAGRTSDGQSPDPQFDPSQRNRF